MKYRFVYKNGGWWLMIKNTDELSDYNEKTSMSNPIMNGLKNLITKDFDKVDPCNAVEYLIKLHAELNNTGICEATEDYDYMFIVESQQGTPLLVFSGNQIENKNKYPENKHFYRFAIDNKDIILYNVIYEVFDKSLIG